MHLVVPGISLKPTAQGQGRTLAEIVPVQRGRHPHQIGHPRSAGSVGLVEQRVAELGSVERLQLLLPLDQLRVVEAGRRELVFVHGVLEVLHRPLGSLNVVVVRVVHVDALEGRRVGKEQPVVEGVAGVNVVAHDDVGQFHGYHRGDRFLARQGVDQPFADQDGIADGGGFNCVGQQDARVHLVGKGKVIGHLQVDDDLVQDGVFIAARGKGRHQAGFHEPVDHVVFSLCHPGARGLEGAYVLRVVALVDRVVHLHAHVLALSRGQLERVTPEVRLGSQTTRLFALNALSLLHVNGHRQPDARLYVHPPTVEVKEVARVVLGLGRGKGAVEADHVAVLILNPDAPQEPAHPAHLRVHVVDPGAH